MRTRYQMGDTESALVPVIWLAFYAIAVVGALAWPRHAAETPELAAIHDGTHDAAALGKTVWK
jgi:hypothetical protein